MKAGVSAELNQEDEVVACGVATKDGAWNVPLCEAYALFPN